MSLINWKVELKFTWTKYSVLSVAGTDNDNGNNNDNNIIFTIKDTQLHVPIVTLLATGNQKLSELLSKGFKRPVYWNAHKTKSNSKDTANKFWYLLESSFVSVNR